MSTEGESSTRPWKTRMPCDGVSLNPLKNDIRVVVGLDFGTTFSGFAYCHITEKRNPHSNDLWHGKVGQLKTNTVLQYDDEYKDVKAWGFPALATKPDRRNKKKVNNNKPIELFKLHLSDLLSDDLKPKLPKEIEYKKAISDYLREIGKVIKETVSTSWPKIKFFEQVLLVVTVPAEYSDKDRAIMRECIYKADLIDELCSTSLQFTTEPEAAAVYCMKNNLEQQELTEPDTTFMIVDCGGGTVDLTTRKLLKEEQLGEVTERSGDFCGSTFIDAEYIKYLREKLGDEPMDLLRDDNYGQMQYIIQEFCKFGKIPFTGDDENFFYILDIQETVPILKEYVKDANIIESLEKDEWVIEIDYESIKAMFDSVIERIFRLIRDQLNNSQEDCSALFLVGGFSESKYLQKKIIKEFQDQVGNISVPVQPIAAIARGAAIYGLSIRSSLNNLGNDDNLKCVIYSRVLKYTYGIESTDKWEEGDPIHRRTHDGLIKSFCCLARRGTKMNINQKTTRSRIPIYPDQTNISFLIYYTEDYYPEYCDAHGMKLLGTLTIDLPGTGLDRPVLFGLTFGQMEIIATAKNKITGLNCKTTFKFNLDDD